MCAGAQDFYFDEAQKVGAVALEVLTYRCVGLPAPVSGGLTALSLSELLRYVNLTNLVR